MNWAEWDRVFMLKLLKSVARNWRIRGCSSAGGALQHRTPSRAPNRPEREAAAVRAEGGERHRAAGRRRTAEGAVGEERGEPGGGAGASGAPTRSTPSGADGEEAAAPLCSMEGNRTPPRYGSLESTRWPPASTAPEDEIISMADSTTTIDDIEGELFKIERIREILVRRESELRYMMDDIQLCKEISRLKKELQKLLALPETEKSNEEKQKEEELVQQIHKLVETRDFLVDDVEFERLREREEDKEMAEFLQSKLSKSYLQKATPVREKKMTSRGQQTSAPYMTKTGLTLLKECCGFTCSIM
ncbi:bMERB domain-containing protein 1-like [Coturnix japonica]|uniref:BMERB domain-containing protein n=3 Tax=Galliformes TaxID=8976 RepID=A0A8C2UDV0_COTJA|nr:bMERB domain-containing protein 1-like [Coturnix japonica]